MITYFLDSDGDGFGDDNESTQGCEQPSGYVPNGNDCDDFDEITYPSAVEVCDGIDNDCDDLIDEDLGEAGVSRQRQRWLWRPQSTGRQLP